VEEYLAKLGLPWTSFRPQYIYGPKTNKRDYIDWFIDRIVRDRVCPLPGDGNQRASLTNVEDVASMMVSVVGKEDVAKGQVREGISAAIAPACVAP
jgi:nucleoside-diphosphate-sugar epimerase